MVRQDVTVTALSWNVMSTGTAQQRARRAADLLRTVEEAEADVLLLQEAWEGLPQLLAAASGLRVLAEAPYGPGGGCWCVVLAADGFAVPGPPAGAAPLVFPGSQAGYDYAASMAQMDVDGRRWGLVSAHLPWGGRSEPARTAAVTALDRWVSSQLPDDSCPVLLGADMNCTPQHSAWRMLTGRQAADDSGGMFWVDAWEACGSGEGWTTGPAVAPLSAVTAVSVGSGRPELEPQRRIDGVFCRGWCHGRPGGPVDVEVFRTESSLRASDHLPLRASLLR